eukprot:1147349-Pelagomonas_calceolata.AAC.1
MLEHALQGQALLGIGLQQAADEIGAVRGEQHTAEGRVSRVQDLFLGASDAADDSVAVCGEQHAERSRVSRARSVCNWA